MIRKIPCALLIVFLSGLFQTAVAATPLSIEVKVEGVEGKLKKNVLSFLSIERQKKAPELNEELLKALFDRAPDEIRTALQPFGFYTPSIKSSLIRKDGGWQAVFRINPGQPVIITKLDLRITGEGAGQALFVNFKKDYPLRVGQSLDEQAYEESKRNLEQTAADHGFLNAAWMEHRILVNPALHTAEIYLGYDTGPQFKFGDVSFIQSKKILSTRFLEKFVTFKKGDPYDVTVLLALQNALSTSGYFSRANVTPLPKKAAGLLVPIEVSLTPAKRYEISVGAGYGTDTGIRGRIDWLDRWVNSRGHRMEVNLGMAMIRQSAIWRYIVPYRPPATHLDYTLGYLAEDTTIETSETYMGGVSFTRPLSPRWLQTLYFNVEREHFTVAGETATSWLVLPGGTWTYKKAPDTPYVNEGIRLIADARGTARAMASSVSFIQGRLRPKYVRGIGGFGNLVLRGDIGATEVDNFQRLPASLRFFAGGDNSIRGYSYKTLGPKNAEGLVEGGKYLLVGSIEYDQKVYRKWGTAIFYDGGNAFSSFPPVWKSGAGVGIRWLSIVGPVKIDFAWSISDPSPAFHVYVSIGPEI